MQPRLSTRPLFPGISKNITREFCGCISRQIYLKCNFCAYRYVTGATLTITDEIVFVRKQCVKYAHWWFYESPKLCKWLKHMHYLYGNWRWERISGSQYLFDEFHTAIFRNIFTFVKSNSTIISLLYCGYCRRGLFRPVSTSLCFQVKISHYSVRTV